ncbi:ABC transporter substrate-binding protein [Arthrobacter zhaoguopingii]|uniref:ABC transporter substrate-binding protein n=1 Tax=Arthrobacter zhaoguopingii TaxID=2681491 RepID=UPI00135BD061|nr:ABC transporter substrate-binding protein [Arthrobacter zhaoguopingii]
MKNTAGRVRSRRVLRVLAAAAVALTLPACTAAPPAPPSPSAPAPATAAAPDTTFRFGAAADPTGLDPAMATDSETFRVTQQLFEGLVGVDPLTSEPAPLLAESWEERNEGRAYAFELRKDVVFHDGESFNARAVCANFSRWFNTPPAARAAAAAALPFETVFLGFSDNAEASLYKGCRPLSEYEVLIELNSRMTEFIPALAQPSFAMSSPRALEQLAADELTETREGVRLSRYALAPVGTGPFRFESWTGDEVRLTASDSYWGDPGEVADVVFTTIAQPDSRLRALKAGRIDGYDFVTVENAAELALAGQQLLQRDPYSVLYLGLNQNFPGVDDVLFRQAVAHAIDKEALIEGRFLNGTKAARQFLPQKLGVSSEAVPSYNHDPDRARELLEEAGYTGTPLPFYYPRNISRPYLPAPEKIYAELSRQLTAAGFNLKPVPVDWNEGYLDRVLEDGDRAFHLLGWSGSYQDPDNFAGALFGKYSSEFGFEDHQLFSKITRAGTLPNGEDRRQAYADVSSQIATRLPAVPLAFPISALAMAPRVASYPVSPVMNEVFNRIDLAGVPAPGGDASAG